MKKHVFLTPALWAAIFFTCRASVLCLPPVEGKAVYRYMQDSGVIYRSDNLIILQLSVHIYQHISSMQTNDFGKVDCNGMVVIHDHEAIVFDSPVNDKSAEELINFLTQQQKCRIKAVIPTHFHEDCVGGLEAFNRHHIPAYASNTTLALLKNRETQFSVPVQGFNDSLWLKAGRQKVCAKFFGEGHTKDNIVGYSPADKAIFGGCLVKETGAGKGFLGDANIQAWPQTVTRLKLAFPAAAIVIPGHGKAGGKALLDYTRKSVV